MSIQRAGTGELRGGAEGPLAGAGRGREAAHCKEAQGPGPLLAGGRAHVVSLYASCSFFSFFLLVLLAWSYLLICYLVSYGIQTLYKYWGLANSLATGRCVL